MLAADTEASALRASAVYQTGTGAHAAVKDPARVRDSQSRPMLSAMAASCGSAAWGDAHASAPEQPHGWFV